MHRKIINGYNLNEHSILGAEILATEEAGLAYFLAKTYGYYLLQIGGIPYKNLSTSPINCKIYFCDTINICNDTMAYSNVVEGNFTSLPFPNDSIDAIIVPHTLESIKDRLLLIEEIYRILIPGGNVFFIDFNPISIFGIQKLWQSNIFSANRFISTMSLEHLLSEAGLAMVEYKTFLFRPALFTIKQLKKYLFMEVIGQIIWPYCGSIYILHAHKKMTTLTPIRTYKIRKKLAIASSYVNSH